MHVKIIKGPYAGRVGMVVATGTFNVFGVEVTGIQVTAGLAGLLVLEADEGYYEEVPAPAVVPGRYKTTKHTES